MTYQTLKIIFCMMFIIFINEGFPVPLAKAETPQIENSLFSAIKKYQDKDFKGSVIELNQLLQRDSLDASIMFNLGLAHYQLGELGKSLAYFRKARSFGADHRQIDSALNFIATQQPSLQGTKGQNSVQLFFQNAELIFPFGILWILIALVFGHFGWHFLNYLRRRRDAIETEEPTPSPAWHVVGSFLALLFLLSLTFGQVFYSSQVRGTIVGKKTSAYSAPTKDAPALFDVTEGIDVRVLAKNDNWLQITFLAQGIENSGWIQSDELVITSSQQL